MLVRPKNTPPESPNSKRPETTTIRLGTDSEGEFLEITDKQRAQHTYVIGVSGAGKTMLLCSMALQDLLRGATVVFIDLIGTGVPYLVECLAAVNLSAMRAEHGPYPALNRLCREKRRRTMADLVSVVRFDQPDFPHRFNPLEPVPWLTTAEQAEAFATVIGRMVEGDMSQMRALKMLATGFAAVLLDTGIATVADIGELSFANPQELRTFLRGIERSRLGGRIRPDLVRLYLSRWFAETSGRDRREAVASTLRAIGILLADPVAARFLSSPKSNLDPANTMNAGKSLLICLTPNNLHTQAAIGGVILSWINAMAMRRSSRDVIAGKVPQVHLFIDEFQRLFTKEMAQEIAVYRNKKVNVILAHQSSGQPEFSTSDGRAMLESVRDNCSTHIVMRIGRLDAQDLAGSVFEPRGHMVKVRREEVSHSCTMSETDTTQTSSTRTRGTSHTDTCGQSWTNSHTQSNGTNWSITDGEQITISQGRARQKVRGRSTARTRNTGETVSDGSTHGRSASSGWARSLAHGEGRSQSHSEGQNWSEQENEGVVLGLQFGRVSPAMVLAHQNLARSSGQGRGGSSSDSESSSRSRSTALTQNGSQSESDGTSSSRAISQGAGTSEGASESTSESESETLAHGRSRSKTTGASASVAVGNTAGTNVGHSDSTSESHSEGSSHGHATTRGTGETRREVIELYSVQEEAILRGYELQALSNRTAIVLQRGGGELRRAVITTLEMPQEMRTQLGPIDALVDLERLIAPAMPEPEPTLGILERLSARLGHPGALNDGEQE